MKKLLIPFLALVLSSCNRPSPKVGEIWRLDSTDVQITEIQDDCISYKWLNSTGPETVFLTTKEWPSDARRVANVIPKPGEIWRCGDPIYGDITIDSINRFGSVCYHYNDGGRSRCICALEYFNGERVGGLDPIVHDPVKDSSFWKSAEVDTQQIKPDSENLPIMIDMQKMCDKHGQWYSKRQLDSAYQKGVRYGINHIGYGFSRWGQNYPTTYPRAIQRVPLVDYLTRLMMLKYDSAERAESRPTEESIKNLGQSVTDLLKDTITPNPL